MSLLLLLLLISILTTSGAELLTRLEKFVCALYGSRHVTDVNDLRYAIFCAKRGKIELHQLPPCRDTLQKHSKKAKSLKQAIKHSYGESIWKGIR